MSIENGQTVMLVYLTMWYVKSIYSGCNDHTRLIQTVNHVYFLQKHMTRGCTIYKRK